MRLRLPQRTDLQCVIDPRLDTGLVLPLVLYWDALGALHFGRSVDFMIFIANFSMHI